MSKCLACVDKQLIVGAGEQVDERRDAGRFANDHAIVGLLGAFGERAHHVDEHLFGRIAEQVDKQLDGLELLKAAHVLLAYRALPNGAGGGRQQWLVVAVAEQGDERVETAVLADEIACLFLFGALKKKPHNIT